MGRHFFLLLIFLTIGSRVLAQPGLPEMQEAQNFVRSSFFSLRDLSYVLAGLIGIFGAIRVYHKWQMGKDITLDIPAWFFSCLFVIVMGIALTSLFGM